MLRVNAVEEIQPGTRKSGTQTTQNCNIHFLLSNHCCNENKTTDDVEY